VKKAQGDDNKKKYILTKSKEWQNKEGLNKWKIKKVTSMYTPIIFQINIRFYALLQMIRIKNGLQYKSRT